MIHKIMPCFCALLTVMIVTTGYCEEPSSKYGLSRDEFKKIVLQYLPEEYVYHMLAIAEKETDYGRVLGRYNAYDQIKARWENAESPQEKEFWWKNIKSLEKIAKHNGKKFYSYKGSSSGAIGYMQTIPSTFLQYGKDGNGDGVKDPLNPHDSLATASNYVKDRVGRCGTLWEVIKAYNNDNHYVRTVLKTSEQLKMEDDFKAFIGHVAYKYRQLMFSLVVANAMTTLSKLEY